MLAHHVNVCVHGQLFVLPFKSFFSENMTKYIKLDTNLNASDILSFFFNYIAYVHMTIVSLFQRVLMHMGSYFLVDVMPHVC